MKRLKTFLNSNQNIENKNTENSSYFLNQLKNEDEKSLSIDESFSISISTDNKCLSNTSNNDDLKSDLLSRKLEEFQHCNQDEYPKDKENREMLIQIIGKKRIEKSLSSEKKIKDYSNLEKKNKCKNIKKHKNDNTYSELINCYNELEKMMSKYSFLDIAKIILKINNGIFDKSNENQELYKNLQIISSIINKKDNITLMCLSILYSKTHSKKDEEEGNKRNKKNNRKIEDKKADQKEDIKEEKKADKKNKEEKVKRKNERDRLNENKIKNKDMTRLIKTIKRKEKEPYIFSEHFYHVNKNIYCYKPKYSKLF